MDKNKDMDVSASRSGLMLWSVYFNNQQFTFLNECMYLKVTCKQIKKG